MTHEQKKRGGNSRTKRIHGCGNPAAKPPKSSETVYKASLSNLYTQGDYGLFQCSGPCCQETFDNESLIREMAARQRDRKIPTELLPVCPRCGRPLTMNLRCDDKFVEDEGWHRAAERYENFLRTRAGQKLVFLELGVGYNTPVIIKYPFWQMTARNPKATYACVNLGGAGAPEEIWERSICMDRDIGEVLQELNQ